MREHLGWGIASKPKAQNLKQHFEDKNIVFEYQSCRQLDYHKDTGIVRQLTETAIIIAAPIKKTCLAVHFLEEEQPYIA